MEFAQYKNPHPKFSHVFWIGNSQKMDWREPEMILKVGKGHTNEVGTYHSCGFSNSIASFGNEAWSEDLIIFASYTSPSQASDTAPLLGFSSVMATFEIFR